MVNPRKEKAYAEKQRFVQFFFLGGNKGMKEDVNNTLVEVLQKNLRGDFNHSEQFDVISC